MTIETPNWAETTADDIERGVDEAIRTVERLADELVSVPDGRRSFENTVLPLDEISNVFNQASGRFGFLSQVSADEELRAVAHRQEERLNVFAAGIGFREDIDRALKAYATRAELEALPDDARRLLEFALRDYRRNGLDLDKETRRRVAVVARAAGRSGHRVPQADRRLRGPYGGQPRRTRRSARRIHRAA